MPRLLIALITLTAAHALADDAPPPPAEKPKLVVVPFAGLDTDVPTRAGAKAAGMLTTEFKSAESFTLVEPKKEKGADPFADALEDARKAVDEARALREKKKFRLADEALKKALDKYKAGAPGLTRIDEVMDAWTLLSAVQFNTGRDEEGSKSLATALALAPDRELPLAQTSALFSKVVGDTRKAVKAAGKGALLVESTPASAPVLVDGLTLGATPLLVLDVPAGLHYWRATLPNGELVGGVVEVAAGKQTKVTAVASNKDPESRMLASLAMNKLDPDLVAAAKEYARATESDLVVFGGLSREGKGLALDSFIFAAKTGEVRRLPRSQFDTELLSAGMEFFNLAGELAKKGQSTGEAVKVPSVVSVTQSNGGTKVAEVKYGVVPGVEAGGEEGTPEQTPDKKPLDKRRVPLQKKPK